MPEFQANNDLMSPLTLFLHADAVVKVVMFGLLLASIWTWAIIFTHAIRLKRINRATEKFETEFWATDDIDAFHARRGQEKLPSAVILSAGLDEWRRSTRVKAIDRSGTRERLATTDRGILLLRQVMFRELEKIRAGRDPLGIVRDPANNPLIDTHLFESIAQTRQERARAVNQ